MELLIPDLCNPKLLVVILVVLTTSEFRFSLLISHLLAKAIPVRGANSCSVDVYRCPQVIEIWMKSILLRSSDVH
ncbi:hypothetical protein [Acerihabitans arboris]|uniref:hypothetical protein n=1 Tax=Acerihabitans arboris TaxID=2691583 RepID=UPI0028A5F411|nr:hypothetical protein [Acerihabitans arboris]